VAWGGQYDWYKYKQEVGELSPNGRRRGDGSKGTSDKIVYTRHMVIPSGKTLVREGRVLDIDKPVLGLCLVWVVGASGNGQDQTVYAPSSFCHLD
jgi:hypothetical protein